MVQSGYHKISDVRLSLGDVVNIEGCLVNYMLCADPRTECVGEDESIEI